EVPLVFGQRTALEQDRVGHPYFSDVVEQRSVLQSYEIPIHQCKRLPEPHAISHDSFGVALRLDVSRFERRCKGAKGCAVVEVELLERRVQARIGDAQLVCSLADEVFEVLLVLLIGLEQRLMPQGSLNSGLDV